MEEQENVQAAEMCDDAMEESRELDENENDVADLFLDADEDMDQNSMVECLRMAGLTDNEAEKISQRMYAFKSDDPATFMEMYGRTIFDQSQIERRNLSLKGLGAFDLRTTKPNGEPWNFCTKADRKLARDMVNRLQPDWIVGAPPCTPFSIWNHGINFKNMNPKLWNP